MSESEPIAIVGMSCRFPAGASNTERFWANLLAGVDAIVDVPKDRWDVRKYWNAHRSRPSSMAVRQAGFLKENAFDFDPAFFGIAPRDAEVLDVQQRLLLEASWQAIEDAGLPLDKLHGSRTAVFMGAFFLDTNQLRLGSENRALIDASSAVSVTATMASNRVSYAFNLRGPSMTIDTACSSSLVATHLACQSLWSRESEMALVGGVNFMLRPDVLIMMDKGGFLSEASRCFSFDARASGYVRAEGAGVVLLKPLSRAIRDRDRIYATILATGCNQDGRTAGITYPNGDAQIELLNETLSRSGVSAREVQFVEAHGTGTQAGDTTELRALHRVFADAGVSDKRWVGSLKSQLGHLEAAAGVASLMKTALAIHHEMIPPNLHFETPNPSIPFDELLLRVPTAAEPWPASAGKRHAVVNSFGYGGTNCCVVLEQAPQSAGASASERSSAERPVIFPLSAKTPEALRAQVEQQLTYLNDHPHVSLEDLAYSAQRRRSHFDHRLALVASSVTELRENLGRHAQGAAVEGLATGRALPLRHSAPAFVYSGMGPQWYAMGRELLEREPVFRATAEECDRLFVRIAGWSILQEMARPEGESRVNRTEVAQPANFVLQVALTALLESYGIVPAAVVGHSVGEVAAAYAAHALSLEQAVQVSYHRSRLQQRAAGGTMLAVGLSESDFEREFAPASGLEIAAVNAPESITLAGDRAAIERLRVRLAERGIFERLLRVDTAYHSRHMDPIRDDLLEALEDLAPRDGGVPLYSSVTGALRPGHQWGAEYWWNNVRRPVRMQQALSAMLADEHEVLVEIGPHPVLVSSIQQTAAALKRSVRVVKTLDRRLAEVPRMLSCLAELYTVGFSSNWGALHAPDARPIDLPHYPLQRERHWRESALSVEDRLGNPGPVFFHQRVRTHAPTWHVELNDQFFPYLRDHEVFGMVLFPGAAYVSGMLELNRKLFDSEPVALESVEFLRILSLSDTAAQTLETSYDPKSRRVAFHSSAWDGERPGAWTLHAQALLSQLTSPHGSMLSSSGLDTLRGECPDEMTPAEVYATLSSLGLDYGPAFRSIQSLHIGPERAFATLQAPRPSESEALLDPVLLDGALQIVAILSSQRNREQRAYIPTGVARVEAWRRVQDQCQAHVFNLSVSQESLSCDIELSSQSGELYMRLEQVVCQPVRTANPSASDEGNAYRLAWEETTLPKSPAIAGRRVLVIATPDRDFLAELSKGLCASADQVVFCVRQPSPGTILDGARSVSNLDEVQQLLREFRPERIVYAWPFAAAAERANQAADELFDFVRLAQWARLLDSPVQLDVITRAAHAIQDSEHANNLGAAALFDLVQVVDNEMPGMVSCRVFDLDTRPASLLACCAELGTNSDARAIAYREGRRFIWRLAPAALAATAVTSPVITKRNTYLVTGGSKGFGLEVARWLAESGAAHVVLASRRAQLDADDEGVLSLMQRLGTRVTLAAVDVADAAAVSRLIEQIDRPELPLRGIFHAAAAYDDRLLPDLDRASFDRVFAAKAHGLENLHAALQGRAVEFVVCFSSISSIVGNRGQAAYVAANSFMDAFARRARAGATRYLSLNWGVIGETGFAARSGLIPFLQRGGLTPLDRRECVTALERALAIDESQLIIANIDREKFATANPILVQTAKFSALRGSSARKNQTTVARLLELTESERADAVLSRVRELIAEVLKMSPARVDPFASMDGLGIDSLKALSLVMAIEESFESRVTVLDMMASPTVQELSARVLARLPRPDMEAA